MCIDNPRVGFANVFDTHPSIEARCAALVKFAGGHDPGPLALDAPEAQGQIEGGSAQGPWSAERPPQAGSPGPWGAEPQAGKPFLPGEPPLGGDGGPWGQKR